MNLPGGWELILVVLVIMVLFGAKRLPDASRSLGRSMRILKAETKGLRDSDTVDRTDDDLVAGRAVTRDAVTRDAMTRDDLVTPVAERDTVAVTDIGGVPPAGGGAGDPTRRR